MKDQTFRGGVPMQLWAQGTLAALDTTTPSYSRSVGANKLDVTQLQNPYRTALIVDAIKILCWTQDAGAGLQQLMNFGGVVQMRFAMDHLGMSLGMVPVWLYGPRLQETNDVGNSTPVGIECSKGIAHGNNVNSANAAVYGHYYWKLPRPLVVPPGSALIPDVQSVPNGLTGSESITFEVAYSARRMPPGFKIPRVIPVPFAAAYVSVEGPTGSAQFLTSPDNGQYSLRNPFLQDLHVQRLVYRTQNRGTGASVVPTSLDIDKGTITIKTSAGQKLIDNLASYIPFDVTRKAWTAPFVLPPNEYLTVQINDAGDASQRVTYGVGMIGWREEAL